MPCILPVSDLRNYNEVLQNVSEGSPVFLTRNGRGCFVVIDIKEYEHISKEWIDKAIGDFEIPMRDVEQASNLGIELEELYVEDDKNNKFFYLAVISLSFIARHLFMQFQEVIKIAMEKFVLNNAVFFPFCYGVGLGNFHRNFTGVGQ